MLAWPLLAPPRPALGARRRASLLVAAGRADPDVAGRALPLRRRRRLVARASAGRLLTALLFGAFAGGRRGAPADVVTLDQRIVLAPDDGSLGPAAAGGRRPARRRAPATAGTSTGPSTSSPWCWPARCATAGATARRWPPGTSPSCAPAPASSTTRSPATAARGCCSATCAAPTPAPPPSHEVHRARVGLGGPAPARRPAVDGAAARDRSTVPAGLLLVRGARRGARRAAAGAGRRRARGWRWSGSSTPSGPPGPS